MQWKTVMIYNADGGFIGYSIHKTGTQVLKNFYREDETEQLQRDLASLNEWSNVYVNWPQTDDPELRALLADETFMPIDYTQEWVVDDEQLQPMIMSGEIEVIEDPVSGNLTYTNPEAVPMILAKVPVDPGAPAARYRAAAEQIARRRAFANVAKSAEIG